MLDTPTQALQVGELLTPLGKDKLLLSGFTMNEELSQSFEIAIEAFSADSDIDFGAAVGLNCAIRLDAIGGKRRFFNGVLVEADWAGERDHMSAYTLVLRPWLWLLTQASDNRIFQNMSVIEIITGVFDKAGFRDYELKVTESYKSLPYVVQYGESHFAFVSRLMETFGIYYFHKHREDRHILILADTRMSHEAIADLPNVPFAPMGARTRDTAEYLTTWRSARKFRTGKVSVNAFDFAKPDAHLLKDRQSTGGHAHDGLEAYVYPHKYQSGDDSEGGLADSFIKARLLSLQAQDKRRQAGGDAPSLYPGGLTKLELHSNSAENVEYLVVAASHVYSGQAYRSGSSGSGGSDSSSGNSYSGTYVLQPSDRPYKAPQVTPSPLISGPQTATVVGPAGEEIYTDEYGRIKVQFHWDRLGKRNENSSRWIRVSQANWGGGAWGAQTIPRIGMEVVVEFLDGDPDRPLVTGTVWNGKNGVPYDLPANKTRMTIKSKTYKGNGFNELRFEDMTKQEEIYLHAQKDMNIHVENNRAKRVDQNQSESVGHNKSIEVGNNHHEVIGGNMTLMVGPNVLQKFVTAKFTALTDKISALANKLGIPSALNMGEGNLIIGVGKNKAETVMVSSSEVVGGAKTVAVGGGYQLSVHGVKHESTLLGAYEEVGQNKAIVVGKRFEVVCGKSKFQMEEDGTITLEGMTLKISGGQSIAVKAPKISQN